MLGTLAVALQPIPARTLTFSERGVELQTGGKVQQHGWDWVVDFTVADDAITPLVQPTPMRSFRLAAAAPQRLLVPRQHVDPETMARLGALLEAHVRRS